MPVFAPRTSYSKCQVFVKLRAKCSKLEQLSNFYITFGFYHFTVVPREIEDNTYAKFLGASKVYYGRCTTGPS